MRTAGREKKGWPDLPEISAKNEDRTTGQRQFDWGPPASATADSFKDWLVYFIIMALLAGGVWTLLDINGRQSESSVQPLRATAKHTAAPAVATATVAPAAVQIVVAKPETRFFVQLGAFADEASAREIFNQLDAEGFAPTLAEPDAQFEIFRIFVGPYPDEAAAEDIAEKLNAIDFHCFVIEQP
ncbi:MAG TPA: hypothetical protein DCG57_16280 [Candidatus Riflebacteria bacterium]|nr:hypothetical protein [Candidatus Riflebacteria bacterium]